MVDNEIKPPLTPDEINLCIKRCVFYHNCLTIDDDDDRKKCQERIEDCIKSICYFTPPKKYSYKFSLRDIFKI